MTIKIESAPRSRKDGDVVLGLYAADGRRGGAVSAAPAIVARPYPPADLAAEAEPVFVPAPALEDWARRTFIDEGGPLTNPDHQHLQMAAIGFLWTNAPCSRQQLTVVGQAELAKPHPALGKWAKARWEFQVTGWFGGRPDFIITIYAPYAAEADDATFCALIEHELYHCAQARDGEGNALWTRTGPKFALRGHDVEEHLGIVRRYGITAAAGRSREFVEAAAEPMIAAAQIEGACGVCQRLP